MRQSWDSYFMKMAEDAAERATCSRLKVGAVITKDNRIVNTGYNGSIHGHDHCIDEGCLLNDEGRCIRTIHAEMNAILHSNRRDLKDATIYVTHEPCESCSKHIAQVGIKRVIYKYPYKNKWNKNFFTGMEVKQYDEEAEKSN